MITFEGSEPYTCAAAGTYYTCKASTKADKERFLALQTTLRGLGDQVSQVNAPSTRLDVDGDLGLVTLSWLQFIASRFAQANIPIKLPEGLTTILSTSDKQQAVRLMARYASEINAYLVEVAQKYPNLLKTEPSIVYRKPPTSRLSVLGGVTIAGGLLAFAGLAYLAVGYWLRHQDRPALPNY